MTKINEVVSLKILTAADRNHFNVPVVETVEMMDIVLTPCLICKF